MDNNTAKIIQDCLLVDFKERIIGESTLINKDQLFKWGGCVYDKPYTNVSVMFNTSTVEDYNPLNEWNYFEKLYLRLERFYQPIKQILKLGDGKIALGGLSFMFPSDDYPLNSFDFYFYSCTVDEATTLLLQCLGLLQNYVLEDYDKNILGELEWELQLETNTIALYFPTKIETITFCCTIFSDKGTMLKNMGPSIFQQGYNYKDGYFSNIFGGITAAMKALVLDINFSKDTKFHILPELNIDILMPGIDREILEGDYVKLSNGKLCQNQNRVDFIRESALPPLLYKDYTTIKDNLPRFIIHDNSYKKCRSIKEWIPEWKSTIIGITDDVYVALHNIKRTFSLDKDVFHLLCKWLLVQIAMDARERLLSLV